MCVLGHCLLDTTGRNADCVTSSVKSDGLLELCMKGYRNQTRNRNRKLQMSKAPLVSYKRKTGAHSQALRQVRRGFQRVVKRLPVSTEEAEQLLRCMCLLFTDHCVCLLYTSDAADE